MNPTEDEVLKALSIARGLLEAMEAGQNWPMSAEKFIAQWNSVPGIPAIQGEKLDSKTLRAAIVAQEKAIRGQAIREGRALRWGKTKSAYSLRPLETNAKAASGTQKPIKHGNVSSGSFSESGLLADAGVGITEEDVPVTQRGNSVTGPISRPVGFDHSAPVNRSSLLRGLWQAGGFLLGVAAMTGGVVFLSDWMSKDKVNATQIDSFKDTVNHRIESVNTQLGTMNAQLEAFSKSLELDSKENRDVVRSELDKIETSANSNVDKLTTLSTELNSQIQVLISEQSANILSRQDLKFEVVDAKVSAIKEGLDSFVKKMDQQTLDLKAQLTRIEEKGEPRPRPMARVESGK